MIAIIMVLLLAAVYFAIAWYAIKAVRWIVRNWTHPTIDAMQAQMLRDIPAIHEHRKAARRQAHSLQIIEAATRRLADGLYGVGRCNWIGGSGGGGITGFKTREQARIDWENGK